MLTAALAFWQTYGVWGLTSNIDNEKRETAKKCFDILKSKTLPHMLINRNTVYRGKALEIGKALLLDI